MSTPPAASGPGVDPGYPWLLPSALLGADGPDPGGRPARRTPRDWAVDIAFFVFAVVFGLLLAIDIYTAQDLPAPVVVIDQVLGVLACASVWLRRRWPVAMALVLVIPSAVSPLTSGAALVFLFTVAVHRPLRYVVLTGGLHLLLAPAGVLLRPDHDLSFLGSLVFGCAITLGTIGWGMFVRARRQLVYSLRERARRAETEANQRVTLARQAARTEIAREMHDVLGHRLSLLSVHAGALEFRPDAPSADVARTAGVIRSSAHQAMQDLRDVIGVLRTPASEAPDRTGADAPGDDIALDRPLPGLGDLARLADESRQAGTRVLLEDGIADPAAVPDPVSRTGYRIVQEGLTNARRHAPGAAADVTVTGAPGDGLEIEVRTSAPVRTPARAPGAGTGSGQGLIGLAERAALAGGRLEHGPTGSGGFRLAAWLPWPP